MKSNVKAIVRYDTVRHTVELRYKNFMYVQMASIILEEIKNIKFFEDGYFIADTNYGEEYFDFQYSLERDIKEDNSIYAKRFLKALHGLTAEDVEIQKIEHTYKIKGDT